MIIGILFFIPSCRNKTIAGTVISTKQLITQTMTKSGYPTHTHDSIFTATSVLVTPLTSMNPFPPNGTLLFAVDWTFYVYDFVNGKTKIISNASHEYDPIAVQTGFIYYSYEIDPYKSFQIYRMKSDGSNAERLTYNNDGVGVFAVSQDGSRIAYSVFRLKENGGVDHFDLSIIDYRKGGLGYTLLASSTISNLYWSTSGNQLAVFDSEGFLIVDANGLNKKIFKSEFPFVSDTLAWSPDDSQIATSVKDGTWDNLYLIDVASQAMTKLTSSNADISNPAWSPDGNKILFQQGTNICVVNKDGTGLIILDGHLPDRMIGGTKAAWSPDSRYIAYPRQRAGYGSLFIVDVTSGSPVQIALDIVFDKSIPNSISWISSSNH